MLHASRGHGDDTWLSVSAVKLQDGGIQNEKATGHPGSSMSFAGRWLALHWHTKDVKRRSAAHEGPPHDAP